MNALVVIARKGKVEEVRIAPEKDIEGRFLAACDEVFSNFGDYTTGDIDAILEDGYAEGNDCAICIHHPHAEPDEKILVIRLDDNILNDILVYDSLKAAREAFVELALEADTVAKTGVTKKELQATDCYSAKGTTIQIYSMKEE